MNVRLQYLIFFIALMAFGNFFFKKSRADYITQQNGRAVTAEIYDSPDCGRSSNTVNVIFENRIYNVNINKNDCIQGKYHVGDRIDLIFYRDFQNMITPGTRGEFWYWVSIFYFLIPMYALWYLIFRAGKE